MNPISAVLLVLVVMTVACERQAVTASPATADVASAKATKPPYVEWLDRSGTKETAPDAGSSVRSEEERKWLNEQFEVGQ